MDSPLQFDTICWLPATPNALRSPAGASLPTASRGLWLIHPHAIETRARPRLQRATDFQSVQGRFRSRHWRPVQKVVGPFQRAGSSRVAAQHELHTVALAFL